MSDIEAAPALIATLLPKLYVLQEDRSEPRTDAFVSKLQTYQKKKEAAEEAEARRLVLNAAKKAAQQAAELEAEEAAAYQNDPDRMYPNREQPDPEKYKSIYEDLMFRILEGRMKMQYREPTYEELEEEPIPEGEDEFEVMEKRVKQHYGAVNPKLAGFIDQYLKTKDTKHSPDVRYFFADEYTGASDDTDYSVPISDRVNPKLKGYFNKWLNKDGEQ